jgi:hypothetical protein
MRRQLRWLTAVIALALFGCLGATAGPAAAAPAQTAVVRAAHFSPDTPGVDIYLTAFAGGSSRLWVPNAEYGGVSPYERVAPGLYVVAMRAHGAAASSPPVVSWNLDVRAGRAYTAAAIGSNRALKTIVLNDELALPSRGTGRVRIVQAASRAPKVDVQAVNGPSIASNVPFASSTPYASVPAGTWSIRATALGGSGFSASERVSVKSESVTSVIILDAPGGGITVRTVLDAAGAARVPVGSVPAGGGGTAALALRGVPSAAGSDWAAALVAVLSAGTVLIARRVRTRTLAAPRHAPVVRQPGPPAGTG